jgi:hypothetical protein
MSTFLNLEEVVLVRPVPFNTLFNSNITKDTEGVSFIQGRDLGVRIIGDGDVPTIVVPWSNVLYAIEEKREL